MKNQKGFTLIELLLVLAIIGIISAIAVPAMLGQRARARDQSATTGTIGRLNDMVGQYDKLKGQGLASGAITSGLNAYLAATMTSKDANPWDPTKKILAATVSGIAGSTKSAFEANMTPTSVGQGKVYVKYPSGTAQGFLGVAVKVNDPKMGTGGVIKKSVAIE